MDTQNKILVINDDRGFDNTIEKALSQSGFHVSYAKNTVIGIQMAIDYQPDLILYNTDPGLINGYEVFKTLRTSSLLSPIPIVFLKENSKNEDFSHELDLNWDHVMTKSDDVENFIKSVQEIIHNHRNTHHLPEDDFNLLFQQSPYGIVLFNDVEVIRVNKSFLNALKRDDTEPLDLKLENIFEKSSLEKIKNCLKHYPQDIPPSFNEQIIFKAKSGEELEMNLVICEFKKTGENMQFAGFITQTSPMKNFKGNHQVANEVCNMLKRENVRITNALEKKITKIITTGTVTYNQQNNSFFTKRENDVLRLSMEGLSIKIIADKLSISSRTVEKYRTKLMEKSGAKNIVEVIVFSLKNNLIKI